VVNRYPRDNGKVIPVISLEYPGVIKGNDERHFGLVGLPPFHSQRRDNVVGVLVQAGRINGDAFPLGHHPLHAVISLDQNVMAVSGETF
jgi:hypothetical protein